MLSKKTSMLPINAAMAGSALWQGLVGSGRWKFAAGVFISSYKPPQPPPPPPTTATGGRVPQKEGGSRAKALMGSNVPGNVFGVHTMLFLPYK